MSETRERLESKMLQMQMDYINNGWLKSKLTLAQYIALRSVK